jgi:hypothetical protein
MTFGPPYNVCKGRPILGIGVISMLAVQTWEEKASVPAYTGRQPLALHIRTLQLRHLYQHTEAQ